MANVKQVIVYRRNLNMRKGKIASQVSHASMKVFFDRRVSYSPPPEQTAPYGTIWGSTNPQHYLLVPLTDEMDTWVKGTGKVPHPTHTCVALGPARAEDIDKITGPEGQVQTKLA